MADFYFLATRDPHFDFAEAAVRRVVARLVGEQILLAHILFKLRESVVEISPSLRHESAPARRLAHLLEHAFLDSAEAWIADPDGIDHHLGTQRFVDRIRKFHAAGSVIAIR